MPWLAAWKEKVGEEEAERIRLDATDRGTCLHALIESRLTGEPVIVPEEAYDLGVPDPDRIAGMFEKVEPVLDSIVETLGVELVAQWWDPTGSAGIVSNGFAGSIDCLALLDFEDGRGPVPAVVDWKTSKRPKPEQRLGNYRMQVTAYRAALLATYPDIGEINDAVICIVPEQGAVQLIHIPEEEFHPLELEFMECLESFYTRLGWPPELQEQ